MLVLTGRAGVAAWAAQPERTIITEAPDILVPFNPLPRDKQIRLVRVQQELDKPATTRPRPSAKLLPA